MITIQNVFYEFKLAYIIEYNSISIFFNIMGKFWLRPNMAIST